MNQIMLSAICRIIVGQNGRRLGHTDIRAAYTNGLFADYYCLNPCVCQKTYYKYINASTPYPHFLHQHYGSASDYRRILSDMQNLVDQCASVSLLRQIQAEVFQWIEAHLPPEETAAVCQNYAAQEASRSEISVFFADTLHHAICNSNTE